MSRLPATPAHAGKAPGRPADRPSCGQRRAPHAAFADIAGLPAKPPVPLLRKSGCRRNHGQRTRQIPLHRKNGRLSTHKRQKFWLNWDVQAAANSIACITSVSPSPIVRPLHKWSSATPMTRRVLSDSSAACPRQAFSHQHHRFAKNAATPDFLIEKKAITPMAMEFLSLAVKAHLIVVAPAARFRQNSGRQHFCGNSFWRMNARY